MNSNAPVGLYVHIPFCLKKCRYCDFFSGVGTPELMDEYLNALLIEIESYRQETAISLDSIFFGGGTPTLFGGDRLRRLLDKIRSVFTVADDAEISIEMNPATADKDLLLLLRQAGVNRVSLGVQSFVDSELEMLGRVHNTRQAVEAISLIKDTGFDNFNLDIMYAIPAQTKENFAYTLEKALSFAPTHLSLYSLILEEGTDFWANRNRLVFPDEEEELKMYQLCTEMLKGAGYEHYEISNYAKKGRACRHNMKYWQLSPYIGIGPAAHSFFEGQRYANKSNLKEYLVQPLLQKEVEETTSRQILADEYVMLGLRTSQGISLSYYEDISGHPLLKGKEAFLKKCQKEEYILLSGDMLRLSEKGFYVSTAIIAEFLA